jgi:hypothetical protein
LFGTGLLLPPLYLKPTASVTGRGPPKLDKLGPLQLSANLLSDLVTAIQNTDFFQKNGTQPIGTYKKFKYSEPTFGEGGGAPNPLAPTQMGTLSVPLPETQTKGTRIVRNDDLKVLNVVLINIQAPLDVKISSQYGV